MRTTSILLVLVVVLCAREAGAIGIRLEHTYRVEVAGHYFGFADFVYLQNEIPKLQGRLYVGPFGSYFVPFNATQGLIGFCVIVVGLIAMGDITECCVL